MPELRRDPVVGNWIIVATERGWRPSDYHPPKLTDERECPFCEGKESLTTSEVFAVRRAGSQPNGPGWQVRAIVSKMPILSTGGSQSESQAVGLYDFREGVGQHEVIVETPAHRHDLDEFELDAIKDVISVYVQRLGDLEKDSRFAYALLFKNHGLVSGAASDVIRHSRSQLIALPIIPKRIKEELSVAKNYYERQERCLFCDVMEQERKDQVRIVAENESFLAFCPYASRSPFEIWILPKKHGASFSKLDPSCFGELAQVLKECLAKLNVLLQDPPFSLVLHTAPFRHASKEVSWQTLDRDYHWYFQLMPRLTKNAGFEWGTGIHINPTPPEEAALLLRETVIF
jgi:UDPglucose--hexose-1-phosphate uridylyltransferase